MARMGPKTKKVLSVASIVFLVCFVAFRPDDAADIVKTLGRTLIDIGNGIGDFFSELVHESSN